MLMGVFLLNWVLFKTVLVWLMRWPSTSGPLSINYTLIWSDSCPLPDISLPANPPTDSPHAVTLLSWKGSAVPCLCCRVQQETRETELISQWQVEWRNTRMRMQWEIAEECIGNFCMFFYFIFLKLWWNPRWQFVSIFHVCLGNADWRGGRSADVGCRLKLRLYAGHVGLMWGRAQQQLQQRATHSDSANPFFLLLSVRWQGGQLSVSYLIVFLHALTLIMELKNM